MENSHSSDDKGDRFTPEIPDGAELLNIQVAGHRFGQSKNKLGLLRHSESRDILKPICDARSRKELAFYRDVFCEERDDDPCIKELRKFVPKFNGLFRDTIMDLNYLRLADITLHIANPSLMDLKLGQKTYDPEATPEKIQAELDKYEHVMELGFRILGLRIYDQNSKSYVVEDKDFGLSVSPETVTEAFHHYTQNDCRLLCRFHEQLQSIIVWFEKLNLNRWKFYSSSLLFAYGPEKDGDDPSQQSVIVKMIDFAHVFPNDRSQGYYDTPEDANYLYGLQKLDKYLALAKSELKSS